MSTAKRRRTVRPPASRVAAAAAVESATVRRSQWVANAALSAVLSAQRQASGGGGGGGDDDGDEGCAPAVLRSVLRDDMDRLPEPGSVAHAEAADAAAAAAEAAAVAVAPPVAHPPTEIPPSLLRPDVDYTTLLLTTRDADYPRREVSWALDEVQLRHPAFPSRLMRTMREIAASTRTDAEQFAMWHFLIIGFAAGTPPPPKPGAPPMDVIPSLPWMEQRLRRHTPFHRIDPALQLWRNEFFVFANARHSFERAVSDGFPRRYVDALHFTLAMRHQYLLHFDHLGVWTERIPPRLPRPLSMVRAGSGPMPMPSPSPSPPSSSMAELAQPTPPEEIPDDCEHIWARLGQTGLLSCMFCSSKRVAPPKRPAPSPSPPPPKK